MSEKKSLSAHDRAAARHARRFTLGVCKSDDHCSQSWEVPNLTADEVEAEKAHYRQYASPSTTVDFYLEVA